MIIILQVVFVPRDASTDRAPLDPPDRKFYKSHHSRLNITYLLLKHLKTEYSQ
jgi:hypothetical protein